MYNLHEPEVQCIVKGKEAKQYEFGNKSSITKTKTGIIVGAIWPLNGTRLMSTRCPNN
ncbi:MAG: hypothetical protein ABFC90_10680 [Bacteroidales bacterium]|nr:hypothetical protein [Bacteroidales bacterium]